MRIGVFVSTCFLAAAAAFLGARGYSQEKPLSEEQKQAMQEYMARSNALDKEQSEACVVLSEWCIDHDLLDEAIDQLTVSATMNSRSDRGLAAWSKLAERIPRVQAGIQVAFDDGTIIRGTCSPKPLLVRHKGGIFIAPIERVRSLTFLLTRGQDSVFKIDTVWGVLEGTLMDRSMVVKSNLGEVTVPLDKIRTLTVETTQQPKPDADPASQMRCCLETLGKTNNAYALYGAAQYYCQQTRGTEMHGLAKNSLDTAKARIEKERAKYPSLRCQAPVEMDRVVLQDGTEMVGQIRARSQTQIAIDVPGVNGPEHKQVQTEQVKSIGRAKVAFELVNRSTRGGLCRDFLAAVDSGQPVSVLTVWGKLWCEFPEEDWEKVVTGMLEAKGPPGNPLKTGATLDKAPARPATARVLPRSRAPGFSQSTSRVNDAEEKDGSRARSARRGSSSVRAAGTAEKSPRTLPAPPVPAKGRRRVLPAKGRASVMS